MSLELQRARLSDLLRGYRTNNELSQRALARRLGINPTSLMAYLDATAYPLPDTRERIAKALGMTPGELEAYLNDVPMQPLNSLEQVKQDVRAMNPEDFLEIVEVVFRRLLEDSRSQLAGRR